ncbi:hypothetical protein VC83_08107 [Pseudogymnoascus destructans]|uniref:Uncharacterized protein n=1 Tax=Pseudogymnoascus destructans TaxID=655981 RepID=A0A176ZZQ9_9PEZI|nr:uncharacterized protein VC83_08107 [Pseudogymnoascus destructans]OAF55327.1 hypothetical protein VC83_08107 [Pseudogymnoascus destructans]
MDRDSASRRGIAIHFEVWESLVECDAELVSRRQDRTFSLSSLLLRPARPVQHVHLFTAERPSSLSWQPDVVTSHNIVIGGDLEAAILIPLAQVDWGSVEGKTGKAVESSGEQWREVESSGEQWRAVESSGEQWRQQMAPVTPQQAIGG